MCEKLLPLAVWIILATADNRYHIHFGPSPFLFTERERERENAQRAISRADLIRFDLMAHHVRRYDLDCALQDFELPAELRGKLLDSWQRGFSTASSENVSFTAAEPRIPLTATV